MKKKIDHPANNRSGEELAFLKSITSYYPFGMTMHGLSWPDAAPGEKNNYQSNLSAVPGVDTESYRYGFNGMEKDNELKGEANSNDFGARMHDPRVGRFLSLDPLKQEAPGWSPYSYAIDNPIVFVDREGEFPGITFMYIKFEAGAGLAYGLNFVEQFGLAYDEIGTTAFTIRSTIDITEQIQENEITSQFWGANLGLTAGITYNWEHDNFIDAAVVDNDATTTPSKNLKRRNAKRSFAGKLGGGFGLSDNDIDLNIGLQAGMAFTIVDSYVTRSISITDEDKEKVNNLSPVLMEDWLIVNESVDNEKGIVTGELGTRDKNWKQVSTGVKMTSKVTFDEKGNPKSNGIWVSEGYDKGVRDQKNEDSDSDVIYK
jgi:RHS repeat-associated protein